MFKRLTLLFVVLALSACNVDTPAPDFNTPTPQVIIAAATNTPVPQPTATTVPSATPTAVPTNTPSPTPTVTPEPVAYGPSKYPANINPLTGLMVANRALLDRRPISFKVDISLNYTRPPFGLSFADIVYTYYHNGGGSRFHAIFYGEDAEAVGPIRSGRLFDDLLVRAYKSFFVYGNADQNIRSFYLNSNYTDRLLLEGVMASCPPTAKTPLCRYEPSVDSSLVGGTEAIHEYFQAKGVNDTRQNLDGMYFFPVAPEDGADGTQVVTVYSQVDFNRWDYDEVSGRYLAFQDDVQSLGRPETYEPLYDKLTEEQIAADNVVVLVVRDGYWRRPPGEIVEIYLSDGRGKAYAFRDGQVYEVFWNRPTQDSVVYLTYEDGSPFPFKPGKTWFEVVNEESVVTQDNNGSWRFKYNIRP